MRRGMICCWTSKGGSGTSVVAAALAIMLARRPAGALLVDLVGDQPAVLGCADQQGPGLRQWLGSVAHAPPDALGRMEVDVVAGLRLLPAGTSDPIPPGATGQPDAILGGILASDARSVVVDAGVVGIETVPVARSLAAHAEVSLLVVRPCYLALRRATTCGVRPTGVVVVSESWRSLTASDVSAAVGAPVVAEVAMHATIARAVDAGLLATRLPRQLDRALHDVVEGGVKGFGVVGRGVV